MECSCKINTIDYFLINFHDVLSRYLIPKFIINYIKYFRYGLGFLLWNIDNYYCGPITEFREETLRPSNYLKFLSPFTQLHGWWHLFAGYATYLHILNCIQQRLHYIKIDYHFRPSSIVGVNLQIFPVQRLKLLKSKYYQD